MNYTRSSLSMISLALTQSSTLRLRQRKDKKRGKRYSMLMLEPKQISQSWTISEILQAFPETRRVFLKRKMMCVGCYMARFCTVSDVARVYSLDADTLVYEIQEIAAHTTASSQDR